MNIDNKGNQSQGSDHTDRPNLLEINNSNHLVIDVSRQSMKLKILTFSLSSLLLFSLLFSCEQKPYGQGENLFEAYCASCHMNEGQGLKSLIPPLAKADYLQLNREKLACIIRYGMDSPVIVNDKRYEQPMAGIDRLNAVEITNILNFIGTSWGNELEAFSLKEVETQLEGCAPE